MSMYGIINITDGTTTVSLLLNAFKLRSWTPAITQPKGGGVWRDSPLATGRALVNREYQNVQELFVLDVVSGQEDIIIREVQNLRRLLEKAAYYSITDWQNEPVWLEIRGMHETNIRYSLVKNWSTPADQDPYSEAFIQKFRAGTVMPGWALTLEREPFWLANPPGDSTCVELSTNLAVHYDLNDIFYPTQSADDAWVAHGTSAINLALANLVMGNEAILDEMDLGIRFRTINIPPGAVIDSAFVRLVGQQNYATTVCDTIIYGELAIAPAVFGTYANFNARVRTTASVNWYSVPAQTIGTTQDTPDISEIVQELVDQATWPYGANLVIFIQDSGSDVGARRDWASWDNVTYDEPELHIAWHLEYGHDVATCEPEIFVSNRDNTSALTHIFVDDGGAFGPNLLLGAPPYDLLPAVPVAGDHVYFGVVVGGNNYTFPNLIFDLATVFDAVVDAGQWQWYEGAPTNNWVGLTTEDNTDGLETAGVNGVFWDFDNNGAAVRWDNIAINGVNAFWVRFRVTTATAPIVSVPSQQNRHVYTTIWSHANLAADQVVGDYPALVNQNMYNPADKLASNTELAISRVWVASRSISRGEDFRLFLTCGNIQYSPGTGSSTTGGSDVNFNIDDYSTTGLVGEYTPAVVRALRPELNVYMTDPASWMGRYRVFLRLRTIDVAADDITLQIKGTMGNELAPVFWESEIVTIDTVPAAADEHWWRLVDFGVVNAVAPRNLASGEEIYYLNFTIWASSAEAAPSGTYAVNFESLILLPVDEWAADIEVRDDVLDQDNELFIDGIGNPRNKRRGYLTQKSGAFRVGTITDWPITKMNNDVILQANAAQRVYYLTASIRASGGNDFLTSDPNLTLSVGTDGTARYFSARGSR